MIKVPKSKMQKMINALIGRLLRIGTDDIVAMILCKHENMLKKTVHKYIAQADVVVCSHPFMYPVVEKYADKKFMIYEALNVEFLLKKSLIGDKLLGKLFCTRVKKVEGSLVRRANIIFATSTENASQLQNIYSEDLKNISISPNGVDIAGHEVLFEKGSLAKKKIIKMPLAIFLGSGHPPNIDAAKVLINKIAPQVPEVYFLLCGGLCWGLPNEPKGKNIGLAYSISDEEKYEVFRVSDIALNPMLSGSGTNIKMLDYMAAGLPVITTPIGARGLDLDNNQDVVICNVDEFPAKIREVLSDIKLYDQLSTTGRKKAMEKYDWKMIAKNMADIIEKEIAG